MSALNELFGGIGPMLTLLRKPFVSGVVSVKTFATNEVQVRLCGNVMSWNKKDSNAAALLSQARSRERLVLCRKSQTNPETGEVIDLPRVRKFNRSARHFIREAGAVLEQRYDREVLFITLTLPGSTPEAIRAFALYDGKIKNAFLQNIRKVHARVCDSDSTPIDYVCVSELQDRGAIHFHIAVGITNKRFGRLVTRLVRSWWFKLLEKYSKKSGTDLFGRAIGGTWAGERSVLRVQCSKVYKSVKCYLAKYLSKARSKSGDGEWDDPSRWWSVSTSLRSRVFKERKVETFQEEGWQAAKEALEKAAAIVAAAGYECNPMYNPWTKEPIGVILFPPDNMKEHIYDWFKLLLRRSHSLPSPTGPALFEMPARWGYAS